MDMNEWFKRKREIKKKYIYSNVSVANHGSLSVIPQQDI